MKVNLFFGLEIKSLVPEIKLPCTNGEVNQWNHYTSESIHPNQ
jgi:hypothetical protein